MGTCCVARHNTQKIDSKAFVALLSEVTAMVDNAINSISVHVYRFEALDALGIFLNGIYSYLLKAQSVILERETQQTEAPPIYEDDGINMLKESFSKFQVDLVEKEFLTDRNAMKLTQNKIFNVQLAYMFLTTQLEKISPAADVVCLKGDFSNGFDYFLGKNFLSPDYLQKEIKEIIEANDYKEKQLKCFKCETITKYFKTPQELSPDAQDAPIVCDSCHQYFLLSSGFFKCEACNLTICPMCDSRCCVQCEKCKVELQYTNSLSNFPAYKDGFFKCDICGGQNNWADGVNHCFTQDCNYDVCIPCRSKMKVQRKTHVIMESQRWWKNQWTECPLLPKERGKYINETGENVPDMDFPMEEADDKFQWTEEWHPDNKVREDPEGWEYSLTWGNPFQMKPEGCFVRRRIFIRRREKVMKN